MSVDLAMGSGIQAMNCQMVLTGSASCAWRCAKFGNAEKTVSVVSVANSQLLFQFLTPHASDMLDPRNVDPDYEVPIFKTGGSNDLPSKQLKRTTRRHR